MKISSKGIVCYTADRINPTERDMARFIDGCKALGAMIYCFDIIPEKGRVNMKGFIALQGISDDFLDIHLAFPNFLVTIIRN